MKINIKPLNNKKNISSKKPNKFNLKGNVNYTKWVIIAAIVLAHIAIIAFVILSNKYYKFEVKTFLGIVGVLICILVINDIIFFVSIKYKEMTYKIVSLVLSVLILIIGAGGSYYVSKLNKTVNSVIENDTVEQYETITGVFTYYTKSESGKTFDSLDDLKSVSNLKVGVITDDGYGTGTIAQSILEENGIDARVTVYSTAEDLLSGLVGSEEDENVDVAVFPTSYRSRWLSDSEVSDAYSSYLENMVDFYSFEEKVKVGDNETANQDLTVEPFNILLIGFAPEDEAMTIGLADTIIVATINPQTFTVSMTSVARDTYTELACARGTRQKINAARGYSKQCLMDTVGELLDLDINYYMEVNFLGVVEIVDAIGGIVVDNPVAFVGQTASGIRGEITVYVPAGENVPLDGEGALAFARERHAYADGDFQRQKNQQMVISRIAEKLLAMSDVNQAIKVMEAAGSNMSTNLSLTQLTDIFNYLVKHKNTTGVTTYDMIDIRSLRLTGYSSWYYSYSMRLPQWIYRLYEGSITETKENIADVLGNYTESEINQVSYLKFFASAPYSRGQLYSAYFDEAEIHEEMPAYYPNLTNMTYAEALAWASSNGVTLNVTFIDSSSSEYNASLDGQVVSQSPRQGALVSEYPTGSITVMGSGEGSEPEYDISCADETACKAFATQYSLSTSTASVSTSDSSKNGTFAYAQSSSGSSSKIKKSETLVLYYYTYTLETKLTLPSYSVGTTKYVDYLTTLKSTGFTNVSSSAQANTDSTKNGTIISVTVGGNAGTAGSSYSSTAAIVIVYYADATVTAHVHNWVEESRVDATCDAEGSITYKCTGSGTCDQNNKKTETIPILTGDACTTHTHTWENDGDSYTDCSGTTLITYQKQKCSCGETQTITVNTTENSESCQVSNEGGE